MKKEDIKKIYIKHKSKFNFGFTLIVCFIIAKLFTIFVFNSSIVVGNSMRPTLSNGDKGISDVLFYKIFGLDRFDIVTVEKNDDLLVKRLIAFPGETIDYTDGVLKINGEIIEEDFISDYVANNTGNFQITLQDDQYFVMGDNRTGNNSWDSRSFGPISYKDIKASGLLIFAKCDSLNADDQCIGLSLIWPYIAK